TRDDRESDLGLTRPGRLDDHAAVPGLLPGGDGRFLIRTQGRERGPERRALEEALGVIVERDSVLGRILFELGVIQRFGAPRADALVPGEIARHLRRARGGQQERSAIELELDGAPRPSGRSLLVRHRTEDAGLLLPSHVESRRRVRLMDRAIRWPTAR